MTGANTDPVSVPTYVPVAAALVRLAGIVFEAAISGGQIVPVYVRMWLELRLLGAALLERRTMQLAPHEWDKAQMLFSDVAGLVPLRMNRDLEFVKASLFAVGG
jgi:hypothetical protein